MRSICKIRSEWFMPEEHGIEYMYLEEIETGGLEVGAHLRCLDGGPLGEGFLVVGEGGNAGPRFFIRSSEETVNVLVMSNNQM